MMQQRRALTKSEETNISAVRMFLPVAVCYFLTNIIPFVVVALQILQKRIYRDLVMVALASYSFNSVVNFPIYYFNGSEFRVKSKQLLLPIAKRCPSCINNQKMHTETWKKYVDYNERMSVQQ